MSEPEIAIVTDSTADIPAELVSRYYIHVVPNVMVIRGKGIEDGIGITREDFYRQLPSMTPTPTTSTPSAGTFENLYETLLNNGKKQIISIHAASALSGIYNTACLAAAQFGEAIQVFDSKQVTLGLGFQVLTVADAVMKGASIEKVMEILQNIHLRARVFAMLDTLEYVRRSGRVSWARARLGNLLNFKPFVEVREGKVLSLGETRTRHKGIERLMQLLQSQGPIDRLAILHTNAENDAKQFLEDSRNFLAVPEQPLIVNITTIIGVYTGPNGLGFAAITKS